MKMKVKDIVLWIMWTKGNPCALLEVLQVVEKSMKVLWELKIE